MSNGRAKSSGYSFWNAPLDFAFIGAGQTGAAVALLATIFEPCKNNLANQDKEKEEPRPKPSG